MNGRSLKVLSLIDEFTRECIALEVNRRFTGDDLVTLLVDLFAIRGRPQAIRNVRKDLGAPNMPFIIGELSTCGIPGRGDFQIAQANTAKFPEFKGRVVFVPTAEYYDTQSTRNVLEGIMERHR